MRFWSGNGCFNNDFGFGMGGAGIMMFIGIIVFGLLIYFLVKSLNNPMAMHKSEVGTTDALNIAKVRLAKGEITTEQYEEIKRNL